MLPVIVLLQRNELRLHVFDEGVAFSAFQLREKFFCLVISLDTLLTAEGILTNHIVAILVLHHELQRTRTITVQCRQLRDDCSSLFIGAKLDTFFDNIGGELVF